LVVVSAIFLPTFLKLYVFRHKSHGSVAAHSKSIESQYQVAQALTQEESDNLNVATCDQDNAIQEEEEAVAVYRQEHTNTRTVPCPP